MLTHTLTDPQGKKTNITEEQALSYNKGNNRLAQGFQVTPIETAKPTSPIETAKPTSPIVTPAPVSALKQSPEVQLPTPQAPEDNLVYAETVKGAVDSARKTLETTLSNEKTTIDTQVEALRKQQADTLAKAKPLTEPFREELENTERRKKFVDDNFEANQRLTNELDSLLTQQNALMAQAQGGAIMSNRARQIKVNRTQQEVSARVGVIEAVMNARNNQITQAYTAIDRSIENIASDRQDSLNYYNTLIELDNQRILTLDDESRKITNEQISLVKGDLAKAEKTAEYVKELMLDPTTAQFMADAGVTLLDSVEEVKTKMAEQGKRQEIIDAKNNLVEAGYEIVAYPSADSFPIEVGGKTLYAKVRAGSALDLEMKQKKMDLQGAGGVDWGERGAILELATEGDPLAIASLGYDPRNSGLLPEKIVEFEKKQAEARNTIGMVDGMIKNKIGIDSITGQIKNPGITGFFGGGKMMQSDNLLSAVTGRIPVIGNIQGAIEARNDRDKILTDLQYLYNTEGFQEFIGLKESGLTFGSLTEGERASIFSAASRLNSALTTEPTTGRVTGYQGTAKDLRNDLAEIKKGLRTREEELATRLTLSPDDMNTIINL